MAKSVMIEVGDTFINYEISDLEINQSNFSSSYGNIDLCNNFKQFRWC